MGSTNAVQVQSDATLMFSAVRLTVCPQVAEVWGEPVERIAVERVLRAVSHSSRAVQRGEADALVLLLAEHATFLGIITRGRQHPRERQQLEHLSWGDP
jgi:hypothetical protein